MDASRNGNDALTDASLWLTLIDHREGGAADGSPEDAAPSTMPTDIGGRGDAIMAVLPPGK